MPTPQINIYSVNNSFRNNKKHLDNGIDFFCIRAASFDLYYGF